MEWFTLVYRILEYLFLAYFLFYNSLQFFFLLIAAGKVRKRVAGRGFEDLDILYDSPFTPPITVVVPAYNEEKTIVESVTSLMKLRFPRYEIVIVNDGSTDETLRVLREAFLMRKKDIDYDESLTTAPVRGYYEAMIPLPPRITRFVLIDKENGGKADALNAGINASLCPFFVSIDADSIIDEEALLQALREMLADDDVIAVGGQVAVLNGAEVQEGRVVRRNLPRSHLARFQMVEYIRAFTIGRTALSHLGSLLIISGVFGVFRKEFVKRVGGYLTRFATHRIVREYCGESAETVCEDMEIVVRLHRYLKEMGLKKRISYVPHPLCWTEVPEDTGNLGRQRNRWHRGLIETLSFHRKMFLNPEYGIVGLFAYPYFFFFEYLGAIVEGLGYLTLPLLWFLDSFNTTYFVSFLLASVGYGTLISVASLFIGLWPEVLRESDFSHATLIRFDRESDALLLVLYAFLENLGYRQLNVFWRVKATFDYFRGKKGWEKFDRIGFGSSGKEALEGKN
ncbi:MAG: glycosyltransferase family 2 protein [Deltaproteobacteria bacterium]|nr:MAG: glycosyltransferase family 2 protein [Deltaproteobacteria bacterium]